MVTNAQHEATIVNSGDELAQLRSRHADLQEAARDLSYALDGSFIESYIRFAKEAVDLLVREDARHSNR